MRHFASLGGGGGPIFPKGTRRGHGRVRADVVRVAADVSGLVSDVFVHDNEKVSKGQQLFRIDQRRFQYALDQAKADVASQQATLDQAKRDLVRSKSLTDLAITRQQVERAQQATDEGQAKLDAANAALEVARLNLERSTVVAAVNGIVTNFDLLPGRYVNAGAAVFALIDSDTFRVEGYFEETKLRRIRIGEDATVRLIGDSRVLSGRVESIAYGIEDQNRGTSNELLASVNPTFSWVRLAQRIPVRIKLDDVPRTYFWWLAARPRCRLERSDGGERQEFRRSGAPPNEAREST